MASYRAWWPWLREFEPDTGLVAGATWDCLVAPPLPYVVRFRIHVEDIVANEWVATRVDGDIVGSATLTLTGSDGGTVARLRSTLLPANPALRAFGMVARPLVGWGHDWVLDQGRTQFLRAFAADP